MLTFKKSLFLFSLLLYASSFLTVIMTSYVEGYSGFLRTMTRESGFFEYASVLLLFSIFVYGMQFGWRHRKKIHPLLLLLIYGFASVALLAIMEELSWGQHIFHFESSHYFQEHNFQQETNLHNFIPAELFSSLIYSSVYTIFIFIPLIYRLLFQNFQWLNWLQSLIPELHTTLIILYGATFQVYFYDNFGAISDRMTLFAGLLLFVVLLLKEFKTISSAVKLHYIFILIAMSVSMLNYKIFGFFNMQYEIREMFVVLASLYLFITLTERLLTVDKKV